MIVVVSIYVTTVLNTTTHIARTSNQQAIQIMRKAPYTRHGREITTPAHSIHCRHRSFAPPQHSPWKVLVDAGTKGHETYCCRAHVAESLTASRCRTTLPKRCTFLPTQLASDSNAGTSLARPKAVKERQRTLQPGERATGTRRPSLARMGKCRQTRCTADFFLLLLGFER